MPDFVIQHGEGFRDGAYAFIRGHKVERAEASPTQYYLLGPGTTRGIATADAAADACRRPEAAAHVGGHAGPPLHVGVVRAGGIGDDLMLAAHCVAIKRRFPHAHITAFVRDNSGILAGHPGFDRLVFRTGARWFDIVRDLRECFDVFYDLRYVAKVWAFHPDYRSYQVECRERFEPRGWYYHNWYDSNARLAELGRNLIELTNDTICCPGGVEDVRLWLRPQDRKLARMMRGRAYAVVHNGAGGSCIAKLWPLKHWERLVTWLHEAGLEVWQIGWEHDRLVPGANDLRGFTSLQETAGLMEGARLVVCEEGAIAHMAQAVRQRNVVVLYGPTPAVCFGYPQHVAVETELGCRGCWYRNRRWHVECPAGHQGFPCMEAIAPEQVMQAVGRLLAADTPAEERAAAGCDQSIWRGLIRVKSVRR